MGFLSKIFGSKRAPEWFNVGDVSDGYSAELQHHANAILGEKGRQGSMPTIVSEPIKGYFGQSPVELQSKVLETLAQSAAPGGMMLTPDGLKPMTVTLLSAEAQDALARGDVFFVVGRSPDGLRHVAVVIMK